MRRNFYSTVAAQALSAISSLAAMIIVSRFMAPAEIGVFAFAIAITAVVSMLQNSGVTSYVIFCPEVTPTIQRQALAVGTAGTLIAVLVMTTIGFVVSLDPAKSMMAWVMPLLSLKIVLLLPSLLPQIMMIRNEEYGKLAVANVVGGTATSCAQIGFAFAGWSYFALIAGELVGSALFSACLLVVGRAHIVFRSGIRGSSEIIRYATASTLGSIIAYGYLVTPSVVIGSISNFRNVGLYSRANLLGQLYYQSIGRAIEPVMRSAIAREGRAGVDLAVILKNYLNFIAPLSAALFGFCCVFSHAIVAIIFGDQWHDAVPIMSVLCCAMYFVPLNNTLGSIFLQIGKIKELNNVRLAGLAVQMCGLFGLLRYGLIIGAFSMVLGNMFLYLSQSLSLTKLINVPLGIFLRPLVSGWVTSAGPISLAAIASVFASKMILPVPFQLLSAGLVMLVAFIIVLRITKHPIIGEVFALGLSISKVWRTRRRGQLDGSKNSGVW